MPITNGTISILRRVRTGDFEHIEPHVTLTFSVEPSEDAGTVADNTRQIVDAQYKLLLGIPVEVEKKTRTKAEKPTPLPEAAPSPAGPVAPTATAPTPVTVAPPSPPVSTVAAPGAAFDAAGRPSTAPVALPPAVTAPSSVATPSTPPATVVAPSTPVVPAAGPGESATALVSDEMMAKRCQDKTDELNALYEPGVGLQKVVALIRQYIDPPGRATQITADKREHFLTALAALA